jgi:DNA invertase Pin-like site-specific DNA recombinase
LIRQVFTILLLVALVGAGSAVPAGAQEPSAQEGPPTELWDEFPLEQPPPDSARESAPRRDRPAQAGERSEGDDGSPSALPWALAVVAALGLVGVVAVLRRRLRAAAPTAGPESAGAARAVGVPSGDAALAVAAPTGGAAPAADLPSANAGPAPARPAEDAAPETEPGAPAVSTRPAKPRLASQRALGYASVSAADGQAGDELKLQIRRIQEACERRGLTLVKVVRDIESHASSDLRRPGLTYALDRLAARDASCLVVTSIERLTRTASHLGTMLGWLNECDARLVVLDLDLDTGTHEGQMGAKALATVGVLERRKVEERTRKGLEAARHMRRSGRPAVSDRPSLKQRIADMRAEGMTLQAIADTLNEEGVPTLRGGAEWRPSSVQAAAGYKRPSRKDRLRPTNARNGRRKAN